MTSGNSMTGSLPSLNIMLDVGALDFVSLREFLSQFAEDFVLIN